MLSSISTVSSSFGAVISITSGALSVMVSIAATLAAVATLPVVIPDFSSEFLWASILIPPVMDGYIVFEFLLILFIN